MTPGLPDFVPPMLARKGEPFDSADHIFEIKWDGTRAQARLPGDGSYRLTNRRRRDLTVRYPELAFLEQVDAGGGAILDGEIVVLQDGKPDFAAMLSREQARDERRIASLSRTLPAHLVLFDMLYRDGASVMAEPLSRRREWLAEFVAAAAQPRLLLSDGVVGAGTEYFAAATSRQLEGVMAKRLSSRYEPGRRSDEWLKIKQTHRLQCAILGYVEAGSDIRSLVIAAQVPTGEDPEPRLRCVGRVGSGLSAAMRDRLAELLPSRRRATPFMPCEEDGLWVEPGLYCTVSYLELTRVGQLRAPVFLDLIVDP